MLGSIVNMPPPEFSYLLNPVITSALFWLSYGPTDPASSHLSTEAGAAGCLQRGQYSPCGSPILPRGDAGQDGSVMMNDTELVGSPLSKRPKTGRQVGPSEFGE